MGMKLLLFFILLSISCVFSIFSWGVEGVGPEYFSAFHDNRIYDYYPDHFVGKKLTYQQALKRKIYFKVERKGSVREVVEFYGGRAEVYRWLDDKGLLLNLKNDEISCQYDNYYNLKIEVCFSVYGEFLSEIKSYFVKDLMVKKEYLDSGGKVEKYSLLDHVGQLEYVFDKEGFFLERRELMKAGQ